MNKHKNDPFVLIGVNSDEDLELVRDVVREAPITWRSFWNGPLGTNGPISTTWNVTAWPTVYLIDASGRIRFRDPDPSRLEEYVASLIAQARGQ